MAAPENPRADDRWGGGRVACGCSDAGARCSHVSHREARELHEVGWKETQMRTTASVVAACALLAVACNRGEGTADAHDQANTPPAERPASEPRHDNAAHPTMRVTGCIEPGVIAGTFMLTQ